MYQDDSNVNLDSDVNNTEIFNPYQQAKNNLYNKRLDIDYDGNQDKSNINLDNQDENDTYIDREDLKNSTLKKEIRDKLFNSKLDINEFINKKEEKGIKGDFKIENVFVKNEEKLIGGYNRKKKLN